MGWSDLSPSEIIAKINAAAEQIVASRIDAAMTTDVELAGHAGANVSPSVHPNADTHINASAPHSGHEVVANKNVSNGYLGADPNGKIAAAQLYTDKLAGIIPTASGWTTEPAPLGELTDDDIDDYITTGAIQAGTAYLTFDMGGLYDIAEIKPGIYIDASLPGASSTSSGVQVSIDGASWTTIFSQGKGSFDGMPTITVMKNIRYIRIYLSAATSGADIATNYIHGRKIEAILR